MKHRYAPQVDGVRRAAARRKALKASGPIPPQVLAPATSRFPVQYNFADGQQERDEQRLKLAVAELMEHFDTVRIVATRLAKDGTCHATWGGGNHYAQVGSVEDWLESDKEDTRERKRQMMRDDDSTGSTP